MYCCLYSLRLSPDFNFHYLHWMIICNRQAGRKTAGLEQPVYKKTDTQISKQSPTLPPTATKDTTPYLCKTIKAGSQNAESSPQTDFFYYYCFHLDAFRCGIHAPVYHRLQHSLWSHTCLTPVVQQSPTKLDPTETLLSLWQH